MPVRYLSDPELARLSTWPVEIEEEEEEEAIRHFTLSTDDLSWLASFNREENRLGVAVQLAALSWLGGNYSFDVDAEARREGHRPLRITA